MTSPTPSPVGDRFPELCSPVSDQIRSQFIDLARAVLQYANPGREQALCLTKLEEAYLWLMNTKKAN